MGVISVCFDDPSDEELSVFSGTDLLVTHYDGPDLDWQEIAERSELDKRRGLTKCSTSGTRGPSVSS